MITPPIVCESRRPCTLSHPGFDGDCADRWVRDTPER
jgi:hypothetical protein